MKQTQLAEIDDRDVSYMQVDTQLKEAQRKIEELRKALNEGTDAKITVSYHVVANKKVIKTILDA